MRKHCGKENLKMPEKTFRAKILKRELHKYIVTVDAPDIVAAKARIIDGTFQDSEWLGRKLMEGIDEILEIEEEINGESKKI